MNLELLFKFVRLANNNPNEHEANAAARRVCKMIEDAKFKLIDTPVQKPVQQSAQSPRYQRPPDEPQPSYVRNPMNDFFRQYYEDRKGAWWNERPPTEAKIPEDYEYVIWDSPFKERVKSEKRDVSCSKCGKIEKTAFMGDASTHLCYECYFKQKTNK